MAETTQIQWTDATWNPVFGCIKVSEGCKFCYMYRGEERWGRDPSIVRRTGDNTFYAPLKWKEPRLIFTCSMSDFFIAEADGFRNEMWDVIRATPQHTYQILTKRPERILNCLPHDWGDGWENVWLGVSVENEGTLHRVETLNKVPAKVRFISAEPLLGPINLSSDDKIKLMETIHWVIIGGESGNNKGKYRFRECRREWMENLITDCQVFCGVPVFVKQTGNHLARQLGLKHKFGGDWNELPESLQYRNWPDLVAAGVTQLVQCP